MKNIFEIFSKKSVENNEKKIEKINPEIYKESNDMRPKDPEEEKKRETKEEETKEEEKNEYLDIFEKHMQDKEIKNVKRFF